MEISKETKEGKRTKKETTTNHIEEEPKNEAKEEHKHKLTIKLS